jgi:hypothetical protein
MYIGYLHGCSIDHHWSVAWERTTCTVPTLYTRNIVIDKRARRVEFTRWPHGFVHSLFHSSSLLQQQRVSILIPFRQNKQAVSGGQIEWETLVCMATDVDDSKAIVKISDGKMLGCHKHCPMSYQARSRHTIQIIKQKMLSTPTAGIEPATTGCLYLWWGVTPVWMMRLFPPKWA